MAKFELSLYEANVPFATARAFLEAALSTDERANLAIALRPIFHNSAPEQASLSDRQTVDEQLRFYTRHRCLRDFRHVAMQLTEKYAEGCDLVSHTSVDHASLAFFEVLCHYMPVKLTIKLGGTAPKEPLDEDLRRVEAGFGSEADWKWLERKIEFLLNCGDSWTAVWLADAVLQKNKILPGKICDALGLAFGLQDRTTEAELLFQHWRRRGEIDQARANYSIAMLYARHHPTALRNDDIAKQYLDEAWDILTRLDEVDDQVVYERIFNRNGLALILYRQGQLAEAAALLEQGIERLYATPFHSGVHHTVLLNNLGRVYAAMGRSQHAEAALRGAVDLDPQFAEYWFDLASFYLDQGRVDDALRATQVAETCSSSISEIPALLGYILGKQGDHEQAAESYARAWAIEPDRADYAVSAAYHLSEAGHYTAATTWHNRGISLDLTIEQEETLDLIALEAVINSPTGDTLSDNDVLLRLRSLAEKYPQSEVVRSNLAALSTTPA